MNKILPYKTLKMLQEENFPLSVEKREKFYKENPNSYLKYGDYIAEITEQEFQYYFNGPAREL